MPRARARGLEVVFEAGRLTVLADAGAALRTTGQPGVVIGTVFGRGQGGTDPYDRARSIVVRAPGGEDMLETYWGGYVAFLAPEAGAVVHVLRDPSGALDCYRSRQDGADLLYSDLELASSLGLLHGEPDPAAVVHHLCFASLRAERTCLAGVREVLPGTSVRFGAGAAPDPRGLWTPWTHAARQAQFANRAEAAARVRLETRRCVSAWAGQFSNIHHQLSGGLDSSIIAACLAGRAEPVTCISLLTPGPGAGELAYAQQVADRISAPLWPVKLDLADSDLGGLASRPMARPGSGMLFQLLDRALRRHAGRTGAEVFFSGGGGDNVFCYLNTAAPAADLLRRFGPGAAFLNGVGDLAALHGCTTWRAGRLALRKALRPLRGLPRDTDFLAAGVAPLSADPHPWLEAPPGAAPGSHEHILWLTAAQGPLASQARHGPTPVCYPLLSQPLVEACLRTPSWMWIAGGRNRAVARDAFAADLPPAILQRRTKGDFADLLGALYQKHRRELAGLLLDGWLASQALLDRSAIEAYLRIEGPATDYRFCRLMEIASAEAWARSWPGRGAAAPAA